MKPKEEPRPDGTGAKGAEEESQSPEAMAFLEGMRQVLKVSKKEVERREAEWRNARRKREQPPA